MSYKIPVHKSGKTGYLNPFFTLISGINDGFFKIFAAKKFRLFSPKSRRAVIFGRRRLPIYDHFEKHLYRRVVGKI